MINKNEQILLKHLKDLSERAFYQNRPFFTDFLDMNEQSVLLNYFDGPIFPKLIGGYPMAERKIAVFCETDSIPDHPFEWIQISPLHPKFSETLSHRDFLGSILGLGLERSCIGDLIVNDSTAYVLCQNRITDFLIQELSQVRHTFVKAEVSDLPDYLAKPKFEIIRGSVASIRLDAVISLAFHLSRTQAVEFIRNGQVFINNRLNTSNGTPLKNGSIISVRHKGKFLFVDCNNKSKKNKCIVEVHKYV